MKKESAHSMAVTVVTVVVHNRRRRNSKMKSIKRVNIMLDATRLNSKHIKYGERARARAHKYEMGSLHQKRFASEGK